MMALLSRVSTNITRINWTCSINEVHTTSMKLLNQDWRREKRLPRNPNKFGPLTNLPDYSFADGRPTPFGVRQLGRINTQREILKKVRKLTSEIDYAVERYDRLEREKVKNRRKILESKLMPKGEKLLLESEKENSKIKAD